ncbi:hypothetical protein [Phenylobacterium sp.]|uniref:hypothetical protein n=1 Tax=Phenylobacterium sp. TaxID=1871053 RepID=UPI00286D6B03|nr:hypothetical protein [Phenylobacterium sp.]
MSPRLTLAAALALSLSACSPAVLKGVDIAALDAAINDKVGDPGTCVLIGETRSGEVVHRFGSNVTCARALPACNGATRTLEDLLNLTAKSRQPVNISCPSSPDGGRTVGWAAGPIETHDELVYAAAMEGPNTPPGVVIADKLRAAFEKVGLIKR